MLEERFSQVHTDVELASYDEPERMRAAGCAVDSREPPQICLWLVGAVGHLPGLDQGHVVLQEGHTARLAVEGALLRAEGQLFVSLPDG